MQEKSQNQSKFLSRIRFIDGLTIAGPYLGFLVVLAVFSLLTYRQGRLDLFLSWDNLQLVTVHAAVAATVALGMTFIMISGGIDLSVGYVVSLVTVGTMLTFRGLAEAVGVEWIASLGAVLAGLAIGAACGCANGLLITRLKVIPFVATLGMMGMARGLAQYMADGKPVAFPNAAHPPAWVPWLGTIEPEPAWLGVGPSVWSVAILGLIAAIVLNMTVFGRHCFAIGSNEAAARLCGIRIERVKMIVYSFAGLLTGWAGILQFARGRTGLHDAAPGLELEVIAAVVIGGGSLTGGEGSIPGTIMGALLITVLSNGCSKLQLPNEFRFIIIGAIIVAVAALNRQRQRQSM